MQKLIYIQFISIFLLDFLSKHHIIPRQLTWFPDIWAVLILMIVIIVAVRNKRIYHGIFFWLIFVFLLFSTLSALILNMTPVGAIFAGIRNYMKFIPLFLVPAVVSFSEMEIRKQLILISGLSLLQFPVAIYQRMFGQYANQLTGDFTMGTLTDSGVLTVYLCCAIAMTVGFYIKKRISLKLFLCLLFVFSIPTMINETKAAIFFIILALFVPVWIGGSQTQRIKRFIGISILGTVLLSIFVPVYDHFMMPRYGYSIIDFFFMENRVERYLAPNTSGLAVDRVGRVDALIFPFKKLADDPTRLIMGLGIGNISESFLGKKYSGDYLEEYGWLTYGALSKLLWEVGLLGVILLLFVYIKIFRDSMTMEKDESIKGAIALGWTGVMAVLFLSLFYNSSILTNEIGFLFWYFSGYIASAAYRKRLSGDHILIHDIEITHKLSSSN